MLRTFNCFKNDHNKAIPTMSPSLIVPLLYTLYLLFPFYFLRFNTIYSFSVYVHPSSSVQYFERFTKRLLKIFFTLLYTMYKALSRIFWIKANYFYRVLSPFKKCGCWKNNICKYFIVFLRNHFSLSDLPYLNC